MNTILIIVVVVIIFLLCKSNCKHVSGFKAEKPKSVCDLIGTGNILGKWTPELLREAKASCTLYESICGPASTWSMSWPILYATRDINRKTTRFELAAKSVVSGGPKECAAIEKCTTCPPPSTCTKGTCQFH